MAEAFYTRHRGPYQLQVCRLTPKRKQPWHTESLSGTIDGPDCEAEAQALLSDPRDSIVCVAVWSIPEQQHVMTFKRSEV